MIVLTNCCMHQQHCQPPQRGIKTLNSRERARGLQGSQGVLQRWFGEPKVGSAGGRGSARQEGGLAELGIINDAQQLFVASSITLYFSLEL